MKCPYLQNNSSCTKKRFAGHSFKHLPLCPYKNNPEKCPYYNDLIELIKIQEKYAQSALNNEFGLLGYEDEKE